MFCYIPPKLFARVNFLQAPSTKQLSKGIASNYISCCIYFQLIEIQTERNFIFILWNENKGEFISDDLTQLYL